MDFFEKRLPVTKLTQEQYDNLTNDLRGKIWVLIKSVNILLEKSGTFDIGLAHIREESLSMPWFRSTLMPLSSLEN
jgi:hypothetical protein